MQSPLPQLTTVLLLIHLGFGCCFHHAHACEADCCVAPSVTAEACPCDTHQHEAVAAGPENAAEIGAEIGHHGEQHHCTGENCTFVASQSALEQAGDLAANSFALQVITADREAASCRIYLDHNLDRLVPMAGSSMRTHLVLRVLLI